MKPVIMYVELIFIEFSVICFKTAVNISIQTEKVILRLQR